MKNSFIVLAAILSLSACVTGPTYLGQRVNEVPLKVDGGKAISFPMTRGGALPSENDEYKIEGAGVLASLQKGSAAESKLTWTFSFVSKKSAQLDSVIVERVTESGGLELVVNDPSPVLKKNNWIGRSSDRPMTKDLSPWLYSASETNFVFKFTIKSKDGSAVVMYQPSLITSTAKAMYLQIIGANKG